MQNIRTQGQGHFKHLGPNLNQLGRGPLGEATYQIFGLYALRFRRDDFFMLSLYKPMLYMWPQGRIWTNMVQVN